MPPKKAGKRKKKGTGIIRVHPQMIHDLQRFTKTQHGGFLSALWDGAKKVLGLVKDNKVISKVAPILGFDTIGKVADQLGWGETMVGGARYHTMPYSVDKKMSTQLGAGLWDQFKKFAGWVASGARKAHDYAKRTQVISKTLDAYNKPEWAAAFRQSGYGQRAVTILPGMFRS